MANIFINNKNLGPVIDVKALPTTDINPNAFYRLVSSKYDMVNGHGKDNTTYPVGYYKPAEGTKWTNSQVVYGSSGTYMDGYSASPNVKMRAGTTDWKNPVPCTAEESSGIWYYDYARDNVYFAWHAVDYDGVNYYSPEELDRTLGVNYLGLYIYISGQWIAVDVSEECKFIGTPVSSYGSTTGIHTSRIGSNIYFVTGQFNTNTTLTADTPYCLIKDFKVQIGSDTKYAVVNQVGACWTNGSGVIGNFLIVPSGDGWFTFDRNINSGSQILFTITFMSN